MDHDYEHRETLRIKWYFLPTSVRGGGQFDCNFLIIFVSSKVSTVWADFNDSFFYLKVGASPVDPF